MVGGEAIGEYSRGCCQAGLKSAIARSIFTFIACKITLVCVGIVQRDGSE